MTILTLRYNEKKIKDFSLMRGQNLTIGRNPDNDIVIDNAAVSGYHARIESVAASFVIRDLNSTNGLFVNKKKVETHALQHNDIISIGKHELVFDRMTFDRSARVDQSQSVDEDFFDDKTRFLDTSQHKELIKQTSEINTTGQSDSESASKPADTKGLFAKLKRIIFRWL